jgi:hypothetical protein
VNNQGAWAATPDEPVPPDAPVAAPPTSVTTGAGGSGTDGAAERRVACRRPVVVVWLVMLACA